MYTLLRKVYLRALDLRLSMAIEIKVVSSPCNAPSTTIKLFSLILARLSSLTNRFSSSYGRLSIFFLLNSLNAGCLSSRCQSQSGYSESAKTLGSVPSLRILAPTTVVDLTSLLSVDAFGASPAAPPLEPFFALPPPTANVLLPPIPIALRHDSTVPGKEAQTAFQGFPPEKTST
ncbi:hypothetical protein RJ641_022620 [Dillenia turbinata]|uniref:Uncharacterized protein n=1 Tax=Dillenia turbinata TaxID=194707 RepID=A0AAN8YRV3_9MAGN